jgi:hypothetical protein
MVYSRKNTSKSTTAYPPPPMVSTIAEHKKLFSSRQICNADTACALYCNLLGRPDKQSPVNSTKQPLRNCRVTPKEDQDARIIIYGPDTAVLKGKRTQPAAAPANSYSNPFPSLCPFILTICLDLFLFKDSPASTPSCGVLVSAPWCTPLKDCTFPHPPPQQGYCCAPPVPPSGFMSVTSILPLNLPVFPMPRTCFNEYCPCPPNSHVRW